MLSCKILRSVLHAGQKIFRPSLRTVPNVVYFHKAAAAYNKIFVDHENTFAHGILEQSLKPYKLFRLTPESEAAADPEKPPELPAFVLNPNVESQPLSTNELFEHFCSLVHYCCSTKTILSEDRFRNFVILFCRASKDLSDAQLIEALRLTRKLPTEQSIHVQNFAELWNSLDEACYQRVKDWDVDQLLHVCDGWYALDMARKCVFVGEALRRMGRKVARMKPEQLVHTMFFCNMTRRPLSEMFDFEVNLGRCAADLSLRELAVMSMGFFKTQTVIRSPELIEHLYHRLQAELNDVEDITLVAILKVLRYSSKIPQVELMKQLLDGLYDQIERISLLSCLHVALLGCDIQYCHDATIERILQRFSRDISQVRLKDIERISHVIGLFNFTSASRIEERLCEQILTALHGKVEEIMKYPRCFPPCVHFLTLKGYYDTDMLSAVLDKNFMEHAYGYQLQSARALFFIDSFIKINLLGTGFPYAGKQLEDKTRASMGKFLTHYMPERNAKNKLSSTDRVLLEIKETTDSLFDCNTFKHLLPHFERPDVIICYDRQQRKAVPLAADCPEDYSGIILTRNKLLGEGNIDHLDTVAIVVAGWNNMVRGKDKYTGLFEMKLQQLRLLGHKCVVIRWDEWKETETPTDRQNLIKRKTAGIIN